MFRTTNNVRVLMSNRLLAIKKNGIIIKLSWYHGPQIISSVSNYCVWYVFIKSGGKWNDCQVEVFSGIKKNKTKQKQCTLALRKKQSITIFSWLVCQNWCQMYIRITNQIGIKIQYLEAINRLLASPFSSCISPQQQISR
jgi:hypothetical protein